MIRCTRLRCHWQPDPELEESERDQLASHAVDADHPLCAVCSRSLQVEEPRTCEKCLTRARENLAEIVDLYALLPDELGHPKSTAYDQDRRAGSNGRPLPGGDVLVLLAGGSEGGAARRLTAIDHLRGERVRWWLLDRIGPLTLADYRANERAAEGREHAIDNQQDDAPSIPEALARWEDDWRHVHNEPAAVVPPGAGGLIDRTLVSAAGYLERRMRWAADEHELFPDFAAELHELRARLQNATSRSQRPVRAPAVCFDCGQDALEREWTDTGLAEKWTCRRCHRAYEQAEYWLAVKARLMTKQEDRRHA
jgi:hypothetical protein